MKNKFIKGFAVCSAVALASVFGAASCEKPVAEFSVSGYNMTTAVNHQYGKAFNYSSLPFSGKLTNGKSATIKWADIEIVGDGVKVYQEGVQTITLRHKATGVTFKFLVNVVRSSADLTESIKIIGFGEPQLLTSFKANTKVKEADYKDTEYKERLYTYEVGNMNPFTFKPDLTTVDMYDEDEVEMDNQFIKEFVTFTIKEGGTPVSLETYLDLDKSNFETCELQFNEEAVGRTLEITMAPKASEILEGMNISGHTHKITVKVQEGYNVYDFNDLIKLNNYDFNNSITSSNWFNIDFEEATAIKAMYLHSNISITKSMLPAAFKDQDGNLKNDAAIFIRRTAAGETFTLNGNYFTISATDKGLRYIDDGGYHEIALFDFGRDPFGSSLERNKVQGDVTIKNIQLRGNAPREDAEIDVEEARNSLRGLQALGFAPGNVLLDNIIMDGFTTSVLQQNDTYEAAGFDKDGNYIGKSQVTIKDSKLVDSASLHTYIVGGKVSIENSELKNATGPSICVVERDWFTDVGTYSEDNYETLPGGKIVYNPTGDRTESKIIENTDGTGRTISTIANIDSRSSIDADLTGKGGWFGVFGYEEMISLMMGYLGEINNLYDVELVKDMGEVDVFGMQVCMLAEPNDGKQLISPITAQINYGSVIYQAGDQSRLNMLEYAVASNLKTQLVGSMPAAMADQVIAQVLLNKTTPLIDIVLMGQMMSSGMSQSDAGAVLYSLKTTNGGRQLVEVLLDDQLLAQLSELASAVGSNAATILGAIKAQGGIAMKDAIANTLVSAGIAPDKATADAMLADAVSATPILNEKYNTLASQFPAATYNQIMATEQGLSFNGMIDMALLADPNLAEFAQLGEGMIGTVSADGTHFIMEVNLDLSKLSPTMTGQGNYIFVLKNYKNLG